MSDAPKVIHVLLWLDPGGLERVVLSLVQEGMQLSQRVSVVCLERPGELAGEVERAGARVYSVDKRPGLRLGTVGRLRKLFEQIRPDVVHTHQIGALFYAGPAARRAGVPVVVHTEHGKHYENAPLRRRLMARWAARSAERFFCVSADIAASVRARRIAPASKIEVVANGIDTARYAQSSDACALREALGIPPDAPVVGTVGRLAEVKRQDVLLRAFARLRGACHLVLVGDGPMRPELERLAAELGIGNRVHFAGYQPAPERFFHVMNVFALTSRSEGMPLAVLEAWAAGVPVVASRVGGLPELIEEGVNGVMFEAGDDATLAVHLEQLLRDLEQARVLGAAGQHTVRSRFDVSVMAQRYQQSYLHLLNRDRAQSRIHARGVCVTQGNS